MFLLVLLTVAFIIASAIPSATLHGYYVRVL